MNSELAAKHNKIFNEARAMIEGHIHLQEQPGLPSPGLLLTRRLKHAISLFQRVLQINPENWSAMWFIGKIYQRLHNIGEAFTWFDQAHQINTSQPDVAREASICAMEIGRHEQAIFFALRASQMRPSDPGLHANVALAYLLAGHIPDAQKAIDQALADGHSDTVSLTVRAMISHFAGNGRVPPPTTPALLQYWRRERK